MDYENADINAYITNLKSSFFDANVEHQRNLDILEEAMERSQNQEEKELLRREWAGYYTTLKQVMADVSSLSASLVLLTQYEQEVDQLRESINVEENEVENENQIDETPQEEVTAEVSAPVETPVEETPEVNTPVEAPVEETAEVSAPVETPVEETVEVNTPVEAPVEETAEVSAPVEAPVDETAEVSAPVEVPVEETVEVSAPVVDENPVVDKVPTIKIPGMEEEEDVDTEIEAKTTVLNESGKDGKAIIVTQAQLGKLKASKESQKELFNKESVELGENPAKQLEDMMNQMSELYGQGKTAEAEAMSEKISTLTKKMGEVNR